MHEEVELFLKEYIRTTTECGKFLYASRGKEFQQEAIVEMSNLRSKATALKTKMKDLKDESSANALLSLEGLIDAMVDELRMLVSLKEDDANGAWDHLIEAQAAVRNALQAHSLASDLDGEKYATKLDLLEKLVFPPQLFFSPSLIVESAKCSICGAEYGDCGHVIGRAYMGELCHRVVTKIRKLTEISIVKQPASKHARMYRFGDDGAMRDIMTWRVLGEKQNQNPT
jgi:hypothetical protein